MNDQLEQHPVSIRRKLPRRNDTVKAVIPGDIEDRRNYSLRCAYVLAITLHAHRMNGQLC